MSIPQPQLQVLRTAFHACRPRSSLLASRIKARHSQLTTTVQHRFHSNESTTFPSSPITPTPSSSSSSSSSSSVSQDEVSHFSRLASSWWDPYGPSRLLHLMNPLRHDFITSCLQTSEPLSNPQKFNYLDIGCGGGIFASSAARKPHTDSVTAIDPTPEVIAVAKAHQRSDPALSEPKLRYLNCAIEDLTSYHNSSTSSSSSSTTTSSSPSSRSTDPTQDQDKAAGETITEEQPPKYDIITLFEVVEHITYPSTFLQSALTHLKPGGWIIGSTISRHPIAYLTTVLAAEAPLVGLVPRGTHDWNKYIKPGELRAWFDGDGGNGDGNENKFGPVRIEGVVYVPFVGWKFVRGSEEVGNYFFGVQKL